MIERNHSLDFVKGFLVEIMILYHSINYFIGADHVILKYIDFVTGSFVFLSGYIISSYYFRKYKLTPRRMYKRLIERGIKIVLIFILINILMNLFLKSNYNNTQLGIALFLNNFYPILILGYKRLAAFEILLPIAYVLIISVLLLIALKKKVIIIFVIAVLFIYCSLIKEVPFNLTFISIGLNGLAFGYLEIENHWVFNNKYKMIFLVLLVVYLAIITFFEQNLELYFMGIVSIISTVYLLSVHLNYKRFVNKTLVMLGQYSLFSYLSQILFLQILFRLLRPYNFNELHAILAFLLTNIFVFLACKGIIVLRNYHEYIDKFYSFVFK